MNNSQFENKVILITGAASGFGRILAEKLSAAGARLVLADLNTEGLEEVAAALRAAGAELIIQRCDVSVESDSATLVSAGVDTFGAIDIAINNAGIGTPLKALIDTEEADLDLNFAVNTKGVFFGMKYQIRQMLAQGCPMKRLGDPEEMVEAMLMLIDPKNSYMNGQAIAVDGGTSAL